MKDRFQHVHLLLNAAGVLHIPGKLSPGAGSCGLPTELQHAHTCFTCDVWLPAETSLNRVTPENLLTNFQINAWGPILVNKAFWPLMAKASSSE